MPRKPIEEGVYQDDKTGLYSVRFAGKWHPVNCSKAAHRYLEYLEDRRERDSHLPGGSGLQLGSSIIYVLRGLPGSGKTTWAKQMQQRCRGTARISKDDLRDIIDGGRYSFNSEKFIRLIQFRMIRDCLQDGHSVIVDDTNLRDRDLRNVSDAAVIDWPRGSYTRVPMVSIIFNTPLEECIRRDALREKPIGEVRLREMDAIWRDTLQFLDPPTELEQAAIQEAHRLCNRPLEEWELSGEF